MNTTIVAVLIGAVSIIAAALILSGAFHHPAGSPYPTCTPKMLKHPATAMCVAP